MVPGSTVSDPAALASAGVTLGIVVFAPVIAWAAAEFVEECVHLVAALGVVWSVLWFFIGKEGPYTSVEAERQIEGTAGATADAPIATDKRVKYIRSFLTPSWLLAVLCSFLGYWTFTVAMTWLPAYFENVMGASTQQGGSMIALPAIWGAIATVGLSWVTQVLGNKGMATRFSRGLVLGVALSLLRRNGRAGDLGRRTDRALIFFTFGSAPLRHCSPSRTLCVPRRRVWPSVERICRSQTRSLPQEGSLLRRSSAHWWAML